MKVSSTTAGSLSCLLCRACERELVVSPVCRSHFPMCVALVGAFVLFFHLSRVIVSLQYPPHTHTHLSCELSTPSDHHPLRRLSFLLSRKGLRQPRSNLYTFSPEAPFANPWPAAPLIAPLEMTFRAPLSSFPSHLSLPSSLSLGSVERRGIIA